MSVSPSPQLPCDALCPKPSQSPMPAPQFPGAKLCSTTIPLPLAPGAKGPCPHAHSPLHMLLPSTGFPSSSLEHLGGCNSRGQPIIRTHYHIPLLAPTPPRLHLPPPTSPGALPLQREASFPPHCKPCPNCPPHPKTKKRDPGPFNKPLGCPKRRKPGAQPSSSPQDSPKKPGEGVHPPALP